ncbi:MAG: hypothetical protein LBR43_03615 [Spiroplasmataceae bacterium]|nr:hypothetical protein [Spiroplasmataceae bacterium]
MENLIFITLTLRTAYYFLIHKKKITNNLTKKEDVAFQRLSNTTFIYTVLGIQRSETLKKVN